MLAAQGNSVSSMAILGNLEHGTRHVVDFTTRIGRALDSQLILQQGHVSSLHAVIRWTARGWFLRDLGSTNGTYVDGARIPPGEDIALEVGQGLGFGRPEATWTVVDVHEPRTCAIPIDDDGPVVYCEGGVLALPTPQHPETTLYAGPDGTWLQETEMGTTAVPDGCLIIAAGRRFSLRTPEAATGTTELRIPKMPRLVRSLKMWCQSSAGADTSVRIYIDDGDGRRELPGGAYASLLGLLAGARSSQTQQGDDDDDDGGEAGWMTIEAICRAMSLTSIELKVIIFAARKAFADLGVADPAAIIERRPQTKEMRIGIPAATLWHE